MTSAACGDVRCQGSPTIRSNTAGAFGRAHNLRLPGAKLTPATCRTVCSQGSQQQSSNTGGACTEEHSRRLPEFRTQRLETSFSASHLQESVLSSRPCKGHQHCMCPGRGSEPAPATCRDVCNSGSLAGAASLPGLWSMSRTRICCLQDCLLFRQPGRGVCTACASRKRQSLRLPPADVCAVKAA